MPEVIGVWVPRGKARGGAKSAPNVSVVTARGEEGLTLIELLIVLVILPIVVGGIAVVMITSLKDQVGLQAKLSDSSDSVVGSAYYSRDIQSAAEITTTPNPSGPAACSSASAGLPGATHILSVEWGTGPTVVSYYYWTPPPSPAVPAPPTQLFRLSCLSGGNASRLVISHGLSTPPPGTLVATLSCVGAKPCTGYTGAGGWIPTFDVTDATIGVTQTTGFQFTLVGSPLTGPQVNSPSPLAGSLLLLGAQTDLTYSRDEDFRMTGDTVTVNGTVDLNSGPASNGPAIQFNSQNDKLNSQGTGAGVEVFNCGGPGVANGTGCPTGTVNSCGSDCSGNTVNPSPTSISPAVPDPLAGWAQTHQPPQITGGSDARCNKQRTTWTCPAGRYSSGLEVSEGVNVTFTGGGNGAYQFGSPGCDDCSLTFDGGDTANFSSGVYSFYGGLQVDGSDNPNTLASQPGGVLFYVADGTTDFAYNGSANKIDLAAMGSGTYKGLLFWQDGSDRSDEVSIAGYDKSPNVYQGEIYAPQDELDLFGFGNNVTIGPVCANTMVIDGAQANISIG